MSPPIAIPNAATVRTDLSEFICPSTPDPNRLQNKSEKLPEQNKSRTLRRLLRAGMTLRDHGNMRMGVALLACMQWAGARLTSRPCHTGLKRLSR